MPFLLGELIVVIMSSYHWLQRARGAGTVFCPLTTTHGRGSVMSAQLSPFPGWGSRLEVVKISQLTQELSLSLCVSASRASAGHVCPQ